MTPNETSKDKTGIGPIDGSASGAAPCSVYPSFCLSGYSEVYLPDLTPDVGIISFKGVGNLEIKDKRMICHEGQVWDIELTNGSFYSCQEGIGGTFYDSKNIGHGSGSHDKYIIPNV